MPIYVLLTLLLIVIAAAALTVAVASASGMLGALGIAALIAAALIRLRA